MDEVIGRRAGDRPSNPYEGGGHTLGIGLKRSIGKLVRVMPEPTFDSKYEF